MADAPSATDPSQDMERQAAMLEAMMETFEKYLSPSTVIDYIGLEDSLEEEILALEETQGKRGRAARMLVKAVLGSPQDFLSPFIYALRETGFERALVVLDSNASDAEHRAAVEKRETLLLMLQSDLTKKIIPSDIIDDLEEILQDEDTERILAAEENRGAIVACRLLFQCIQRKNPDWPTIFVNAIHRQDPQFAMKLGPALGN